MEFQIADYPQRTNEMETSVEIEVEAGSQIAYEMEIFAVLYLDPVSSSAFACNVNSHPILCGRRYPPEDYSGNMFSLLCELRSPDVVQSKKRCHCSCARVSKCTARWKPASGFHADTSYLFH